MKATTLHVVFLGGPCHGMEKIYLLPEHVTKLYVPVFRPNVATFLDQDPARLISEADGYSEKTYSLKRTKDGEHAVAIDPELLISDTWDLIYKALTE